MPTVSKACSKCNNIFYKEEFDIFTDKCSFCQQAERVEIANERSAKKERKIQDRINYQNQIEFQQNLAQLEKIQDDLKRLQYESTLSLDQAQELGYNYISDNFPNNNYAQLTIQILLDSRFYWTYKKIFITEVMNDRFDKGISLKIGEFRSPDRQVLISSAKQAGIQNAQGSLASKFSLNTGIQINGLSIPSETFESNFTSKIDEVTGEIKMNWNHPFYDDEFNQSYSDGVNDVYWELNTEINKINRLKNEVFSIKKERKKIKKLKNNLVFYKFLLWTIPIITSALIIHYSKEWTSYFYLLLVPPLAVILVRMCNSWEENNWNYLSRTVEINDNDNDIDQISFFDLANSDKFTSLSASEQFSYRLKNHKFLTLVSLTLFLGMFYLAIFQFNLPHELKKNLDLILSKISQNFPTKDPIKIKEPTKTISSDEVVQLKNSVSLKDAVELIEGEIASSFNAALLIDIYGFEKRFPIFNSLEGAAEVTRLNNLIDEKIKNLN